MYIFFVAWGEGRALFTGRNIIMAGDKEVSNVQLLSVEKYRR
jgi:hypothetical protein